jgi:hypothetical protein
MFAGLYLVDGSSLWKLSLQAGDARNEDGTLADCLTSALVSKSGTSKSRASIKSIKNEVLMGSTKLDGTMWLALRKVNHPFTSHSPISARKSVRFFGPRSTGKQ